ncbi:DUF4179 domain-containing protein [Collinsella sp. AM24-1]|uniref:DUF4179 domain-containing protein n=1 Tax=unclassified Collinsella TaxID=2637548 RepID=UPI000E40D860|nr:MULTISPECIES: DUF4179 domain-containing protein [unclassified Collinsella]RGK63843.1 DUF4179 domain-containing protein [Collinsella sp. TF10-11AT]RGM29592.1 DUF4179 domain-containing protein [Collinsella sp. OM08-14AT]RGN71176.1 DUF4179 domain-containing protein [Collinsella sp. OM04-5]RHA72869.1 DUF4179 domain-containing protein [Collinsella sp. AM43-1]RHF72577.1 DUF4179 domain-containing protein [Collinsella sp. AM24-1]
MTTNSNDYRHALEHISFTDNAKQHMANSIAQSVASSDAATAQSNFNGTRRKPRIARHPVRTVARIAAVTAVLAIVIGGAGTAMATGVLPLPSDMLSDIFDGPASQTEIIDRIGRPVGASCSNNGVTVTADAIMGDKDMVTIAYTLTFDDPAALKKLSEPGENGTIAGSVDGNVYVDGEHGGQGQSWLIDKNPNDSSIQYFAQFSVESPGLMGRTVRTHINSLVVPRAGKELPEYKKILTGPWDLKFQLNYEDTSVTIPAPKSVNFNGTKATIQEATVSCVGVSVRYNIDRSIEHDNNSGKMSQNMEESMDAVGNIPLIVTFKDGHVEDATSYSGYFANKLDNGTTDVHKTWPFSQVCDTDKIASVQIGDTVIPMNS